MKRLFILCLLLSALCAGMTAQSYASVNALPAGLAELLSSGSPGSPEEDTLNGFLVSKSIALSTAVGVLADSKGYYEAFTAISPEQEELVTGIGAEDFALPGQAVVISVPDALLQSLTKIYAGDADMPEEVYGILADKLFPSVPQLINGRSGVDSVVVSSILTYGESYAQPEGFTGQAYVVLLYENAATATAFVVSGENIISANTTVLFLTDDMRNALTDGTALDNALAVFSGETDGFALEGIEDLKIEYIEF